MTKSFVLLFAGIICCLWSRNQAFSINMRSNKYQFGRKTSICMASTGPFMKHAKNAFAVLSMASMAFVTDPTFAHAADNTNIKSDKKFELCLSKCVFEETKPPPIGSNAERLEVQRGRGEIIRDCRQKCATTKEQLLIGKPKASSTSSQ